MPEGEENEFELAGEKKKLSPIIAILTMATLFLIWASIVRLAYPDYLNTRTAEPLAEIFALYPLFFMLLGGYILSFLFLDRKYLIGKWTMFGFILLGAVFLWYTPYLLSGFVKQADTIWHMGMAANVSPILDGQGMPFSSYVTSFPLSYVLGNMLIQVTGTEMLYLANYVLPAILMFIMLLLFYLVLGSYFHYRVAGLALLISLPLFYYVSLHFSPQVIGIVLIFSTMLLLNRGKLLPAIIIGILILPFTHIISFVVFIGFLALHLGIQHREKLLGDNKSRLTSKRVWLLVILAVVAMSFLLFTDLFNYGDLFFSRFNIGNIAPFLLDNLVRNPWFKMLVGIIFVSLFMIFSYHMVKKGSSCYAKNKKNLANCILYVPKKYLFIISFSLMCLAMGVLIAIAENSPVLLERGLMYFIPFSLALILWFSRAALKASNYRAVFAIVLLGLFLAYPLGSYPVDAYNSFSESESAGLEFIGYELELNNTSITFYASGQLDAYITPEDNITMKHIHGLPYDWYAYRQSGYFKDVMHNPDNEVYEPRFEGYDRSPSYNKIYSNPTFYIYNHVGEYNP